MGEFPAIHDLVLGDGLALIVGVRPATLDVVTDAF